MDWKLPWDGGCRCGRVRFTVTAPPLITLVCHCRGCQRMTSSAYALGILLPATGFSVTQGETEIGGLHGATRHYHCAYCKNWMYTIPDGMEELVALRPTMIDDVSWFSPYLETCTSEKLPWVTTPALRSYERFPPPEDLAGLLKDYAQHVERTA